ncbi:hypothetical protein Acr_09g0005400 [Actinidia rufa]|uniref:Uncharacterized protein n=1 Tax=Actinidia rufa TaxID=165716 RepID=A0A7J0F5X4_9ERIC|nr:hypothetical protein Acr_09g0005400 [Actinidia rufa]
MESVTGHQGSEDASSNVDIEEGSSSDSDMDFDDSEEGCDVEPSENNEEADAFMGSYSDALTEELKASLYTQQKFCSCTGAIFEDK